MAECACNRRGAPCAACVHSSGCTVRRGRSSPCPSPLARRRLRLRLLALQGKLGHQALNPAFRQSSFRTGHSRQAPRSAPRRRWRCSPASWRPPPPATSPTDPPEPPAQTHAAPRGRWGSEARRARCGASSRRRWSAEVGRQGHARLAAWLARWGRSARRRRALRFLWLA
eukprot:scaffold29383_cov102-Isochrysis_galbana.AAC.1